MKRREMVERIALKKYGTKNNIDARKIGEISQMLDYITEVCVEALCSGEKIRWKNFFTAEISEWHERYGRNPRTNEVEKFPAVKSVNCKFSQAVKDAINGRETAYDEDD